MNQLKAKIEQDFSTGKLTIDNLSEIIEHCQDLGKRSGRSPKGAQQIGQDLLDPKQMSQSNRDISDSWESFIDDSKLSDNIELANYLGHYFGNNHGDLDLRKWNGHFTQEGYSFEAWTTPFLEKANIYYCQLEDGYSWFSDDITPTKEDSEAIVKKLLTSKRSDLYTCYQPHPHSSRTNVNDAVGYSPQMSDTPKIDQVNKDVSMMQEQDLKADLISLIKYYVLLKKNFGATYKEDDYFGEPKFPC